ncbi:ATP-binding protein [Mycoplasmopsis caviae]|uniref:ATP-binding protein n=1 Tax=Mycoplasmopsis caviae TaxID=55603 RepID=A0A3P8KXJ1_9BACT|nr:ATP-binding protein [Mycoplasmopsis caviae]UUD34810.1 ATP-binding protein [Mycoplasmopsis caviae]VDR42337.1 conjugal transfer ATP-binding protein TraC [Mycoplasmopsis caviae]
MLQPKNISKQHTKIFKNITLVDMAVALVLLAISGTIGYTTLPQQVNSGWKFGLSAFVFSITSVLLIKSKKYNCRFYVLIARMIKHWFRAKKFTSKIDKRSLNSKLLIPYDEIVEDKFVKTKKLKGGIKYLAVVKFNGKTPWNEDEIDRNSFLKKYIEILDETTTHFTIVRTKELMDYTNNFESLKSNMNRKLDDLQKSNASIEVIENYQRYYESVFEDFEHIDEDLYVDSYYAVVYDKNTNELVKSINSVINQFVSMDCESELISGVNLIKFLGKLNHKEIDIELANKYLYQQQFNYRKTLLSKNQDDYGQKIDYLSTFKNWIIKSAKNLKVNFKKFGAKLKELFSKLKKLKKKNKKEEVDITTKVVKPIEMKKDEEEIITLDSLLKPNKLIFKSSYFIKDDKYYSIQTVSDLPTVLDDGWAIPLFDNNSIIIWNLMPYSEEEQAKLLDKTNRKITDNATMTKSKYAQKGDSLQLEALEYLEDQLQIDRNKLFNSALVIINEAETLKELKKIEHRNYSIANKSKINLNPVPFKQFEAFAQSCLIPTDNLKESVQMSSHNIAYGWPFENESNNDGNSFILAETASTGEPIIFDQFYKKSERRTNYNMITVGSSGKGKSTDMKKAFVNHLASNNKVYIIDPQNEYKSIGRKFGATIIDLGSGINTVINPLEVQTQFLEDDEEMSIELVINKHLEWLEEFFSLVQPEWKTDHLIVIMKCVRELYEKKKLYKLKSIEELSSSKIKWPIMSDLIQRLRKYKFVDKFERDRKQLMVANIKDHMESLFEHHGKYQFVYNGQTNINLDNDFIIFNTQKLFTSGDIKSGRVGTYVLLSFIQNKIVNNYLEDKTKNTIIGIDELHMYVDPDNMTTLNFVYKTIKTARKFNAGAILGTQNPSDLLGSNAITRKAEAILQNCQYSKFFGLRQRDLESVIEMYKSSGGLNESHIKYLADSNIGCLLFSLHMYSKIKANIYYNEFEEELFFTKGRIGRDFDGTNE